MPPRPLPRYDVFETHIGQPLIVEKLDVRSSRSPARAPRARGRSGSSSAFATAASTSGSALRSGGSSTGSRRTRQNDASAGIHDQPPQLILGVVGGGVRRESGSRAAARPRLRPARDRAAESGRHRRGSGSAARAPPRARASAAERRRWRRVALSVQYACLTAATVWTDRFAEAQLGALLIPLRDDVLLARRVDLAIPEQRLRERDLNARLQVRIEAADRTVASSSAPCPTTRSRCRRPTAAAAGRRLTRTSRSTSTPRVARAGSSSAASRCSSARASSRTPARTRRGSRRLARPRLRCRAGRSPGPDCARPRAERRRRA